MLPDKVYCNILSQDPSTLANDVSSDILEHSISVTVYSNLRNNAGDMERDKKCNFVDNEYGLWILIKHR